MDKTSQLVLQSLFVVLLVIIIVLLIIMLVNNNKDKENFTPMPLPLKTNKVTLFKPNIKFNFKQMSKFNEHFFNDDFKHKEELLLEYKQHVFIEEEINKITNLKSLTSCQKKNMANQIYSDFIKNNKYKYLVWNNIDDSLSGSNIWKIRRFKVFAYVSMHFPEGLNNGCIHNPNIAQNHIHSLQKYCTRRLNHSNLSKDVKHIHSYRVEDQEELLKTGLKLVPRNKDYKKFLVDLYNHVVDSSSNVTKFVENIETLINQVKEVLPDGFNDNGPERLLVNQSGIYETITKLRADQTKKNLNKNYFKSAEFFEESTGEESTEGTEESTEGTEESTEGTEESTEGSTEDKAPLFLHRSFYKTVSDDMLHDYLTEYLRNINIEHFTDDNDYDKVVNEASCTVSNIPATPATPATPGAPGTPPATEEGTGGGGGENFNVEEFLFIKKNTNLNNDNQAFKGFINDRRDLSKEELSKLYFKILLYSTFTDLQWRFKIDDTIAAENNFKKIEDTFYKVSSNGTFKILNMLLNDNLDSSKDSSDILQFKDDLGEYDDNTIKSVYKNLQQLYALVIINVYCKDWLSGNGNNLEIEMNTLNFHPPFKVVN